MSSLIFFLPIIIIIKKSSVYNYKLEQVWFNVCYLNVKYIKWLKENLNNTLLTDIVASLWMFKFFNL